MSDDLRPCPFCECRSPQIEDDVNETILYYVYCWDCDAQGPKCESKGAAIIEWNKAFRTKPVEQDEF